MKPLNLSTIAEWSGGTLRLGSPERCITRVHTDSRSCQPGDLFVALNGENFDGHDFISEVTGKGAIAVLARHVPADHSGGWIECADPLQALQNLAAAYRASLSVNVVAVTGSSGKTSTKEMIAAVLATQYKVRATRGNLNNHIGVPLTLLELDPADQWAVVEIGMNHPGEISPLTKIAQPKIGVISSIGWSHIEFFKDRKGIAHEKSRLLAALTPDGVAIIAADNEFASYLAAQTQARVVDVGICGGAGLRWSPGATRPDAQDLSVHLPQGPISCTLPVPGWHMAANAALAAACGMEAGISATNIAAGLANISLPAGRLSVRPWRDGWLLDDSYNANPDSMDAAFKTLSCLPGKGRRVALLGSMGELGSHASHLHEVTGAAAARNGIDLLLAMGPNAAELTKGAAAQGITRAEICADHQAMAQAYLQDARNDDLILVKGSRFQKMELLLPLLGGES